MRASASTLFVYLQDCFFCSTTLLTRACSVANKRKEWAILNTASSNLFKQSRHMFYLVAWPCPVIQLVTDYLFPASAAGTG